jgi:C-terminal processing protease CtpA/Prc
MRLKTNYLSAIVVGAALAVGQSATAQPERPAGSTGQQQDDQQQRDADNQPAQRQNANELPGQPPRSEDAQRNRDAEQQPVDQQQARPVLGVAFAREDPTSRGQDGARRGLEVAAIMPGSAAQQADLQQGDVIVSANGQEIRSSEELDALIQQRSVGDTLDLVILRDNQQQQMQVTLQAAPDRQGSRRPDFDQGARSSRGWLGVTLDTDGDSQQGVTIERTYPAGPAARAGLNAGDQILQVAGQQVATYEDVLQALSQTSPGDSVDLVVATNGQQQQVSVRLDDAGVFADAQDEFDSRYMWRDPSGRTAEIPEHDMMLEQHRRFAEQHERIEQMLREVQQDLAEIKQQLNGRSTQRPADQPTNQ